MKETIQRAGEWAAELYEQRTWELAEMGTLHISQVHPAYRVTTHEVMAEFKFSLAPWMVEFHKVFRKEMKKRHLLQVLSGKMKSDEWLKKYRG